MTSYKILKKCGYRFKITDNINNRIKGFFVRYYIVLIGLLFTFSILYIDSYRVSDIIFNKETEINNDIEKIIKKNYKKLLWMDYCNINYNELALQLRKKYSSYPYINVYEKNNEILVEIFSYDEKYEGKIDNVFGNIVAKKDAIIDTAYIYSGTSNVYKNKYVKKGDILISGNILDDIIVSAKGLIMGYTYELIEITIPKKYNKYETTDNLSSYHKVNFLSVGFNIGKKESFEYYDLTTEDIFDLYGIFTIEKVIESKKIVEEFTMSKKEAEDEALRIVDENFNEMKSNDKEMICNKLIYKIEENPADFKVFVLVKAYESLGVFVES